MLVNKTTGGLLVSLFITLIAAIVYAMSIFFTREQQFEHYKDQQKQLRREVDTLKRRNLEFERRMVEFETHVENMEESGD